MFVVLPSNIDYLMDDVRLHVGDTDKTKFSDSLMRAALLGGIKMLQRRWKSRYIVFVDSLIVAAPDDVVVPSGFQYAALPDGYGFVPNGLKENDVFRNPYHTFIDPSSTPVSQEDEFPVVLAAALILRKSHMTSSAESFQSWSDGEFSFSNLSAARSLQAMFDADQASLDLYFRKRLAKPVRSELQNS